MNLFEKLNRLDDSLIESKRAVKKKKLTESFEEDKKKLLDAAFSVKCKLDDETVEYAMYVDVNDFIENELLFAGNMLLEEHPQMLFWKYGDDSDNNFGGYFEVYESNKKYPDTYYQIVHDRLYDITDEVNSYYNYDDDIDEMLTESELTDREKLMKTFPDDFGHWSTRPVNKTPAQHKTMNDYARDPNTPKYDSREVTTKPEMSSRDKLLKTFPDLDIRSSKDFLKEAVKDTDYVIALYHGAGRYTFFTEHDTMTSDIKKAATYRSKMMAESDIKYAVDASQRYGTPSDDPLYEDRFSVMTVADFKKNPSVTKDYKPADNDVLIQQKKDEEALAHFIANISKKYNISINNICTKAKQDADELLHR